MSAYLIDFSDPLRAGFSIPAGGFNGPGGSSANTSLRLYGRGALEWGEAVDEDLVRLTENFASASSPTSAIAGQIWVERSLYYKNTSLAVTSGWYYYDLNSTAANKWTPVAGISAGNVTDTRTNANIEGRYYYWNGVQGGNQPDVLQGAGLYGFYSLGRYEPAAWRKRSHMEGVGAPAASLTPAQYVRVHNDASNDWLTPSSINLSGAAPNPPSLGMLWYNTTTGILQVYTVGGWQNILGPTLNAVASPTVSNSVINMSNYSIINLATPVNPQDATTKAYVDNAISSTGATLYVARTGSTMSGNLTINSSLNVTGVSTFASTNTTGVTTAALLNVSTTANIAGALTVSGSTPSSIAGVTFQANRVTNLALTPASASEATSKQYVDNLVTGATSGALTPSQVALVNPGTPKNGDIIVVGSVVYVRAGGVNRQVFPAQWAD